MFDPATGVCDERLLRPALEMEVARGRRFNREFAFVLVGIDQMRQRFDYRDETAWEESFIATAKMLRGTRNHVDRVYRYGMSSFALVLPESGARDVQGLVRRLTRTARRSSPAEGEPGGPLPCHYGATFFPQAATTTEDLLRRAEVTLRLAESSPTRVQIDSAEAREMAAPETLRTPAQDMEVALPAPAYESSAASRHTPKKPHSLPRFTRHPAFEPAPEPAVAASYEPALEPVATTSSRSPCFSNPLPRPTNRLAWSKRFPCSQRLLSPSRLRYRSPWSHRSSNSPSRCAAAPSRQRPESSDQRLAQLMKRMEETEELMRTLRKAG